MLLKVSIFELSINSIYSITMAGKGGHRWTSETASLAGKKGSNAQKAKHWEQLRDFMTRGRFKAGNGIPEQPRR